MLPTAPKGTWIRIFADADTGSVAKSEVAPRRGSAGQQISTATLVCVGLNGEYDWTFRYVPIAGSENSLSYHLTVEDVGCYISYRLDNDNKGRAINYEQSTQSSENVASDTSSGTQNSATSEVEQNKEEISGSRRSMTGLFGSVADSEVNDTKEITEDNSRPQIDVKSESRINSINMLRPMGPVVPGPPRLLDLEVVVLDTDESKDAAVSSDTDLGASLPRFKPLDAVVVGNRLVARGQYIGGNEGSSEYWWLRVTDLGERTEVKPVRAITASDVFGDDDPRVLVIGHDDLNCEFKVKCRPTRDDGAKGEIFTSKPTPPVRVAYVNLA